LNQLHISVFGSIIDISLLSILFKQQNQNILYKSYTNT
jgi:hypothetical protein